MKASMAATCVLSVIVILLISGLEKMVRNILSPASLYKTVDMIESRVMLSISGASNSTSGCIEP